MPSKLPCSPGKNGVSAYINLSVGHGLPNSELIVNFGVKSSEPILGDEEEENTD